VPHVVDEGAEVVGVAPGVPDSAREQDLGGYMKIVDPKPPSDDVETSV
jgi:hypothetical protein